MLGPGTYPSSVPHGSQTTPLPVHTLVNSRSSNNNVNIINHNRNSNNNCNSPDALEMNVSDSNSSSNSSSNMREEGSVFLAEGMGAQEDNNALHPLRFPRHRTSPTWITPPSQGRGIRGRNVLSRESHRNGTLFSFWPPTPLPGRSLHIPTMAPPTPLEVESVTEVGEGDNLGKLNGIEWGSGNLSWRATLPITNQNRGRRLAPTLIAPTLPRDQLPPRPTTAPPVQHLEPTHLDPHPRPIPTSVPLDHRSKTAPIDQLLGQPFTQARTSSIQQHTTPHSTTEPKAIRPSKIEQSLIKDPVTLGLKETRLPAIPTQGDFVPPLPRPHAMETHSWVRATSTTSTPQTLATRIVISLLQDMGGTDLGPPRHEDTEATPRPRTLNTPLSQANQASNTRNHQRLRSRIKKAKHPFIIPQPHGMTQGSTSAPHSDTQPTRTALPRAAKRYSTSRLPPAIVETTISSKYSIRGVSTAVGPSTIPDAGLGAFLISGPNNDHSASPGHIIATYEGTIHSSAQEYERVKAEEYVSDYVWEGEDPATHQLICVDAAAPDSCIGRYANDGLSSHSPNVEMGFWKGLTVLIAISDIEANEELFLSYGPEYWSDPARSLTLSQPTQRAMRMAYPSIPPPESSALPETPWQPPHTLIQSERPAPDLAIGTEPFSQEHHRLREMDPVGRDIEEELLSIDPGMDRDNQPPAEFFARLYIMDFGNENTEALQYTQWTTEMHAKRRSLLTLHPEVPTTSIAFLHIWWGGWSISEYKAWARSAKARDTGAPRAVGMDFSLEADDPINDPFYRGWTTPMHKKRCRALLDSPQFPPNSQEIYGIICGSFTAQEYRHYLGITTPVTEEEAGTLPATEQYNTFFESILSLGDDPNAVTVTSSTVKGQSDLRIATLNANGLDDKKIDFLMMYIRQKGIDVLCLQDTRLTEKDSKRLASRVREGFKDNVQVRIAPIHDNHMGREGKVGGQFIIIRGRWAAAIFNFTKDNTGLGVLTSISLRAPHKKDILILSSYWPVPASTTDSKDRLWNKVQAKLTRWRDDGSPLDFIQDLIESRLAKHLRKDKDNMAILVGDLNSTWKVQSNGGAHHHLQSWATNSSWDNPLAMECDKSHTPIFTHWLGIHEGEGIKHIGVSWIDHILINRQGGMTFVRGGSETGGHWIANSDHRPLWLNVLLPGGSPADHSQTRLEIPRRRELKRQNRRQVKDFRQKLNRLRKSAPLLGDPGDQLLRLARFSVSCCPKRPRQKVCFFNSSRFVDGWSPQLIILLTSLAAIVDMRQHITGANRRNQWRRTESITQGIKDICDKWESSLLSMRKYPAEEIHKLLNTSDRGPTFWKTVCVADHHRLAEWLMIEEKRIKSSLHGRSRHEHRLTINEAVIAREQSRIKGKMAYVIKSILGTHEEPYSLHELRLQNGERISDPVEIHNQHVIWWKQWYADKGFDSFFLTHQIDWTNTDAMKDSFMTFKEHLPIPIEILEKIWTAITEVSGRDQVLAEIKATLDTPITYDEFSRAIDLSKDGSAPGVSGCSYSMMKEWNVSTRQEAFGSLTQLWQEKRIPPWWQIKYLCPKPKIAADEATLSDLRPIQLIETPRKLWIGIIVAKIVAVWEKQSILSNSQYGFRSHRGCHSAILQVVNALEEAEESGSEIHGSTWDIKRAFDSVSKPILIMSWERLGVPKEVAEYIVAMDINSTTVPMTPLALNTVLQSGYAGLTSGPSTATKAQGFIAENGAAQGDTSSPSNWTASFDILLRALERWTRSHSTYVTLFRSSKLETRPLQTTSSPSRQERRVSTKRPS